jgi:hypothetical protein
MAQDQESLGSESPIEQNVGAADIRSDGQGGVDALEMLTILLAQRACWMQMELSEKRMEGHERSLVIIGSRLQFLGKSDALPCAFFSIPDYSVAQL